MLLNKTARSSTLKLGLLYIAVFSAAVFALLAYVYLSTASYLEENSDAAARVERDLLTQAYDHDGRAGVVAMIEQRTHDAYFAGWLYALADPSFARIAGNFGRWPGSLRPGPTWSAFARLPSEPGSEDRLPLRATYRTLPDGSHILLARQVAGLDAFTETMATTFVVAGGLFLVLAAAAGISTARRSVTRIETINATSREIMHSGLGSRIPLRGTGDEWDELAANLNSMLDRIEQLVETNRQVSDNIAHDLRTPLTRMRARLERTVGEPLDRDGYRGLIDDTIAGLDAILRTFASLLRISRIEASNGAAGFRRLDLGEIAAQVVELFDAAAEETGVRLSYDGDRGIPVVGDRDLLFDAISNLVDNALKHGGGAEVRVSARRSTAGTVFSIADRGPGVPRGEWSHIFKRFYRLERSRNSPGNGLGLSLVAAVGKLHDARIELADNNPGLRLELHFPPPPHTAQTKATVDTGIG